MQAIIRENDIQIKKVEATRLGEVDLENVQFGRTFTDHMFSADYSDGNWVNLKIEPFGPLAMNPATAILHYGQGIFRRHESLSGRIGEGAGVPAGDEYAAIELFSAAHGDTRDSGAPVYGCTFSMVAVRCRLGAARGRRIIVHPAFCIFYRRVRRH